MNRSENNNYSNRWTNNDENNRIQSNSFGKEIITETDATIARADHLHTWTHPFEKAIKEGFSAQIAAEDGKDWDTTPADRLDK